MGVEQRSSATHALRPFQTPHGGVALGEGWLARWGCDRVVLELACDLSSERFLVIGSQLLGRRERAQRLRTAARAEELAGVRARSVVKGSGVC